MRLARQFHRLGPDRRVRVGDIAAGETRQDRVAVLRKEAAAQRDLDRVVDRFRNVGKQRRHFRLASQEIVRRQATAVVGGDDRTFGDGDQRVMRFIVFPRGKERLVGRDQRQFMADRRDRWSSPRPRGRSRRRAPVRHRGGRRKSASAPAGGFRQAAHDRIFIAVPIGPRGPPVRQISPSPCSASQPSVT